MADATPLGGTTPTMESLLDALTARIRSYGEGNDRWYDAEAARAAILAHVATLESSLEERTQELDTALAVSATRYRHWIAQESMTIEAKAALSESRLREEALRAFAFRNTDPMDMTPDDTVLWSEWFAARAPLAPTAGTPTCAACGHRALDHITGRALEDCLMYGCGCHGGAEVDGATPPSGADDTGGKDG